MGTRNYVIGYWADMVHLDVIRMNRYIIPLGEDGRRKPTIMLQLVVSMLYGRLLAMSERLGGFLSGRPESRALHRSEPQGASE